MGMECERFATRVKRGESKGGERGERSVEKVGDRIGL